MKTTFLSIATMLSLATSLPARAAGLVCPAPSRDCKMNTVANLCRYDADDYAVYNYVSQSKQAKNFFFGWIDDCKNDTLSGLSTAVHETVHYITSETAAYPLINGGTAPYQNCEDVSGRMLKPKVLANQFKRDDGFVSTYITGDASSSTDFCSLLDEMNAYSHDLNTAVHLRNVYPLPPGNAVDHRAGLLALMSFFKAYADLAQRTHPLTWKDLNGPLKPTVQTLWAQADRVLSGSCGVKDWGGEYFFNKLCDPRQTSALLALGVQVPAACSVRPGCMPPGPDASSDL